MSGKCQELTYLFREEIASLPYSGGRGSSAWRKSWRGCKDGQGGVEGVV